MARRVITPELYQKLLTAYREGGGNHTYAARVTGVGWKFAKRAYFDGWPKKDWAVPIKRVIDGETAQARGTRLDATVRDYAAAAEASEKARKDARDTRVQEGMLIKRARGAGLIISAELLKVLRGCKELGDYLEKRLKERMDPQSKNPLKLSEGLEILRRLQSMVAANADMSQLTMRMERLYMGEPEEIKALQLSAADTGDLLVELEAIQSAIAVARPGLRLVKEMGDQEAAG